MLLAAVVSGLFGTVLRGPITPLCDVDRACSKPAAGVKLTFLRHGRPVTSIVTSSTGRYRVRLLPGSYSVRAATASRIEHMRPTSVAVRRGVIARRNFFIDTGIR